MNSNEVLTESVGTSRALVFGRKVGITNDLLPALKGGDFLVGMRIQMLKTVRC